MKSKVQKLIVTNTELSMDVQPRGNAKLGLISNNFMVHTHAAKLAIYVHFDILS